MTMFTNVGEVVYFFLPRVALPFAAGAGEEDATLDARVLEAEAALEPVPFFTFSTALF